MYIYVCSQYFPVCGNRLRVNFSVCVMHVHAYSICVFYFKVCDWGGVGWGLSRLLCE